jgi:hypothetical protein
LFVYPRLYNKQGEYEISNNTVLIAEVQNMTADGHVYNWGVPYLTINYLIADYARGQFQMAHAIRTNFENQGGGYELKAICDPALPVSTASASPTSSIVPTGTATSSPTPLVHHGSSSDTGAIVGGVVGGVLGLILIVGGLGFLFYRSRQRKRAVVAAAEARTTAQSPYDEKSYGVPVERVSQYTATSPTDVEAGELSSDRKGETSVNQWLSSQGSEVRGKPKTLEQVTAGLTLSADCDLREH